MSTSGSFLTLRSIISRSAASSDSSPWPTTSRSTGVIRVATVPPPAGTKRTSRSVSSPLQPPVVVDDDQRAHPALAHQRRRFGQRRRRRDGVRVADDDVLRALDLLDFAHLRPDVARRGSRDR